MAPSCDWDSEHTIDNYKHPDHGKHLYGQYKNHGRELKP